MLNITLEDLFLTPEVDIISTEDFELIDTLESFNDIQSDLLDFQVEFEASGIGEKIVSGIKWLWKKIKEFFHNLWERLKEFGRWFIGLFRKKKDGKVQVTGIEEFDGEIPESMKESLQKAENELSKSTKLLKLKIWRVGDLSASDIVVPEGMIYNLIEKDTDGNPLCVSVDIDKDIDQVYFGDSGIISQLCAKINDVQQYEIKYTSTDDSSEKSEIERTFKLVQEDIRSYRDTINKTLQEIKTKHVARHTTTEQIREYLDDLIKTKPNADTANSINDAANVVRTSESKLKDIEVKEDNTLLTSTFVKEIMSSLQSIYVTCMTFVRYISSRHRLYFKLINCVSDEVGVMVRLLDKNGQVVDIGRGVYEFTDPTKYYPDQLVKYFQHDCVFGKEVIDDEIKTFEELTREYNTNKGQLNKLSPDLLERLKTFLASHIGILGGRKDFVIYDFDFQFFPTKGILGVRGGIIFDDKEELNYNDSTLLFHTEERKDTREYYEGRNAGHNQGDNVIHMYSSKRVYCSLGRPVYRNGKPFTKLNKRDPYTANLKVYKLDTAYLKKHNAKIFKDPEHCRKWNNNLAYYIECDEPVRMINVTDQYE